MATSQDIANKANEATLKRMPITFVQRLKKSAPVILTVSIVMLILEYLGFLHGLEFVGRDLFLALQKPKQLQYVRIVGIDEDDYRTYFGNHLPLRPDRVQRLIQAVATANPRVIGIDIDTSSWKEKDIWTEEQLLPVTSKKPKLIWAADAIFTDKQQVVPLPVQGGYRPVGASDIGLAVFPKDSDGLFRRSLRKVPIKEGPTEGLMPTFPWAVFQAAVPQHAVKKSNELLLNFAGNLYDLKAIPAREVFKWSEGEGFSENNYFYDKVVIIGNVFHTARDEHPTPIGTLPGVKLMAQAIESEMDGGGIHVMNDAYMLVLEILVGIGLVALNHFLTMGRALVVSVFAVFTVAPVCSFLAFSSFTMWMNFVPIIVAVLVHQLFDHANEYRRLYSELASHSATTPPEK